MLLALVLLAQQALPAEIAPVRSLVRVPAGILTQATVNALELDVASVRRTGEVDLVADARDRKALADAGIPFTVVHEDLAAFYASRLLRSEEHTSELQSLRHLVCRLLLEKKKKT